MEEVIIAVEMVYGGLTDVTKLQVEFEERSDTSSRFGRVKGALEKLGLASIEDGAIKLTDKGRGVANRETRKNALQVVINDYPPYQELLSEEEKLLKKEDAASYFKSRYGLSERVCEGAALFFFRMASMAGLGEYKKGRGDIDTRLEFTEEARQPTLEDLKLIQPEESGEPSHEASAIESKGDSPSKTLKEGNSLVMGFRGNLQEIRIEDEHDWSRAEGELAALKGRWKNKYAD